MKKIITVSICISMLLAMSSCSGRSDSSAPEATQTPAQTAAETAAEETNTSSRDQISNESPAKQLLADFHAKMADGTNYSTEQIAEALIKQDKIPFSGTSMAVKPGYLNGFNSEINGFAEGTFFGPMISSIPFAGYIFRLEDGADTDAFVSQLNENADLAWNICTQADEKLCEASGNMVFFIMAPASFEDEE